MLSSRIRERDLSDEMVGVLEVAEDIMRGKGHLPHVGFDLTLNGPERQMGTIWCAKCKLEMHLDTAEGDSIKGPAMLRECKPVK